MPKIAGRLIGRGGESQRLQGRETFADNDLQAGGFLPVVVLHLGVNELGKLALVILEDILDSGFLLQVTAEMGNHLPGQVVKQIGMVVIGDVIKVNQGADEVILQTELGLGVEGR